MKSILAIDPGAKGGFAWNISGQTEVAKMPETVRDLVNLLERFHVDATLNDPGGFHGCRAYLEQVGGYVGGGGQPGSAMFSFGRGFGQIEGALTALEIPYELVTPQRWIKALGLGSKGLQRGDYAGMDEEAAKAEAKRIARLNAQAKVEWKHKLRAEAQRRYPQLVVTLDNADALLILEYALAQQGIARPDPVREHVPF